MKTNTLRDPSFKAAVMRAIEAGIKTKDVAESFGLHLSTVRHLKKSFTK